MIYSWVLLFMFYLYLVWKKTENIQIVKRSPPITYVKDTDGDNNADFKWLLEVKLIWIDGHFLIYDKYFCVL